MIRRSRPTAIECEADFPDDCLWDEDEEEVLRPAGMALSEAVVLLLENADMRVSDPEMDEDHNCWYLDVDWRGERFRVQVVQIETCLIVVFAGPSLLTRLMFWKGPRQADLAEHIAGIIFSDPRFTDIRLFDLFNPAQSTPYRPTLHGE